MVKSRELYAVGVLWQRRVVALCAVFPRLICRLARSLLRRLPSAPRRPLRPCARRSSARLRALSHR